MSTTSTIATKLIYAGLWLLLAVTASIGVTLWVTWQLEGGAAAVNEAGRLRMQIWRLDAARNLAVPQERREALIHEFTTSLDRLRTGDPERPLFVPWTPLIRERFDTVELTWSRQRALWDPSIPINSATAHDAFSIAEALVARVDDLVMAIELELARLTRVLNLLQFVMIVLAVAGAVFLLYTGQRYVMQPLTRLARAMLELQRGVFSTRVTALGPDEFGQLSAGFNQMAATLQDLYGQLEAKVAQKTRDLEVKRANLQVLYEMSLFLSGTDSLHALSDGFVQRLRQRMEADGAVLRWADQALQNYLLLAEDQVPREIVLSEQALLCNFCECGRAHLEQRTRVIPIQHATTTQAVNCANLGFRTIVSIPVRLQHRVLGEINLFYRRSFSLHEGERELLDALAGQLANAVEGLRANALERENAVAQERTFLARELHDSIAQSLAFLKIQVQLLQGALRRGDTTAADSHVAELEAGLEESLADVRELLMHFRTRAHDGDIVSALHGTLTKFRHQTDLATYIEVHGEAVDLPPDVQLQVLNVLQEALSNVRKHARAHSVVVHVHKGSPWRFVVSDDGVGFDPTRHTQETRIGLRIMQERAAAIGARLTVHSVPGQGTQVELSVPVDAAVQERTPTPRNPQFSQAPDTFPSVS